VSPTGSPTTVAATDLPSQPDAAPTPTRNPENLSPTGATPTVPPTHTIQPGDTFGNIAARSGLSVQQLQALNPGVNPTSLQAGQLIRLR
jgi:LysM repeat protein